MKNTKIFARAKNVLMTEAGAVRAQVKNLDAGFAEAVKIISRLPSSGGKLLAAGVGKSGVIARKISATFSSLGVPSVFVNPAELAHGDLGMVAPGDAVLVLSHSGESDELKKILPHIRAVGADIIAMTGRPASWLSRAAGCALNVTVEKEACPYNIVPTASTTAMLAMGDAVAMCVAEARGFKKDDFAKLHPGGQIGRRLNLKIGDLMRSGCGNPVISENSSVKSALLVMTSSNLGAVSAVDARGRLTGYFTDGDLRRNLQKNRDILSARLKDVMTKKPKTVTAARPAFEAAVIMKKYNCDNLPVVDAFGRPVGIVDERDLISSGLL